MLLIIYLLHVNKTKKVVFDNNKKRRELNQRWVEVQPKPLIIIEKEKAQLLRTIKNALFYSTRIKAEHFGLVYDDMQVVFAQEKGDPRLTLIFEGWRQWKMIIN